LYEPYDNSCGFSTALRQIQHRLNKNLAVEMCLGWEYYTGYRRCGMRNKEPKMHPLRHFNWGYVMAREAQEDTTVIHILVSNGKVVEVILKDSIKDAKEKEKDI
jgi:hypothetical protein